MGGGGGGAGGSGIFRNRGVVFEIGGGGVLTPLQTMDFEKTSQTQ